MGVSCSSISYLGSLVKARLFRSSGKGFIALPPLQIFSLSSKSVWVVVVSSLAMLCSMTTLWVDFGCLHWLLAWFGLVIKISPVKSFVISPPLFLIDISLLCLFMPAFSIDTQECLQFRLAIHSREIGSSPLGMSRGTESLAIGTATCPDILQSPVLTAGARIAHRSGGGCCSCRMGLQWEMLKDQTVKRFEGGPSQERSKRFSWSPASPAIPPRSFLESSEWFC